MLKRRLDNPRYPHWITVIRTEHAESINPYKNGEESERIVYNGIGRSYTDTTTTGSVKVEYNKRKAVIPKRFSAWNQDDIPQDGDTIIAQVGEYEEHGVVKDFEGDNQRSIIYWEYIRN